MEEAAMFISLNTLALVFSTLYLPNTIAKSTVGLTPGRCNIFGPNECKAYYRIKGQPESDERLTTEYDEQRCSYSRRFVKYQDLEKSVNRIGIQVDCLNQTANVIWTQRIWKGNHPFPSLTEDLYYYYLLGYDASYGGTSRDKSSDEARQKLSGFLLEVEYAVTEDPPLKLRYVCYRIILDTAVLLPAINNKGTLLEFGLPCFKSAIYAYMRTSVVMISSRNKTSYMSTSRECFYRIHRQNEKYEISPRMECHSDCMSWRPHLRLQIVQNEHGECKGLRLLLNNIVQDLWYIRFFIVHNESGEVVLDQILDYEINSSVREIMEICCKDQISSTCDGTRKFISDFVSCIVKSSPATTIADRPRPEIHWWIPGTVGIASICLISLVLLFLFRDHFAVCKKCNISCFQ